MRLGTLFLLPIALGTSGCVANLKVANYANGPQTGLVYALPMAQFEVKIQRRISECNASNMKVVTKFEVTKKLVEDPEHLYVIDPKSLSTFFNSSSVEVKYHEDSRILKSLNATVEDKAAPAIVSAIKVAGTALGVPAPAGGRAVTCNTANGIPKKVSYANAQLKALKAQTVALEAQSVKLAELVAQHKIAYPGSDPLSDPTILAAHQKLVSMKQTIGSQRAVVTAALKPISHTTEAISWPMNGNDLGRSKAHGLPQKVLDEWVGRVSAGPNQKRAFEVFFSLKSDSQSIGRQGTKDEKIKADGSGLFYRNPIKGSLTFETHKDPKIPIGSAGHEFKTLDRHRDTIPQLGFVDKFQVSTGAFESAEFAIEFSKNGYLTQAGYKSKSAPSEALSSVGDALATQLAALEKINDEKEQSALDAEKKRLETQVAIEEAQNKLNPPSPTESQETIDMLNSDVELLKARLAEVEAEKRILELLGQ